MYIKKNYIQALAGTGFLLLPETKANKQKQTKITIFITLDIQQKKKKKKTVTSERWETKETSPTTVLAYCLEENYWAMEQRRERQVESSSSPGLVGM